MYGMYYDLPLDYATLIFREIRNAVITKQEDQGRGTEPKNLVFNRFFAVLLGDALMGEGKLPSGGKMIKIYEMKSYKPTILKTGYSRARPLPARILAYLGSEDQVRTYIRGHRTPAPSPATPPRVGLNVGEIAVYLRTEVGEGAGDEIEEETHATAEAVTPKSEVKTKRPKRKRTPKKRVDEEEAPKSPTEVAMPKKKAKRLTKMATSELMTTEVNEPAESEQPLQRRRRKALFVETSTERSPSPLQIAVEIAQEIKQEVQIEDVTGLSSSDDGRVESTEREVLEKYAMGTQPKPIPSATHTTIPAVLVQRDIEKGQHSPIPTQADRTEDIPSSSVPSHSGDPKLTPSSQKDEGANISVHSPKDTSPPHTEVFVASVTHKSDPQTTSELVEREHNDSVALEQPQDSFNKDLKGVSEPSSKKPLDRTSIDASSVEHRGLEENPPELNIQSGSVGAKDSLAKSETYVVSEVPSDIFVTKDEFKTFVDKVFQKFEELQSSVAKGSEANSKILAEALNANTEALKAIHQTSLQNTTEIKKLTEHTVTRTDLKECEESINIQTDAIKTLGDICMDNMGTFASKVVHSAVEDLTKLRDEIKDMTRSVMVPNQPQASTSAPPSSTSAPDLSALASKTDLETMGRMVLSNLNLIASDISKQGNQVAEELKKNAATVRFQSDVKINALSLATEDILKKITKHVDDNLCKHVPLRTPKLLPHLF